MQLKFKEIIIIMFILFSGTLLAQERDIHGLVLVDFRDEYPEGVYILNKRTNVYSVTDLSGSFHIKAKEGDTLQFQGDYLIDRNFIVKANTFNLDPFIVHMNYEVITLADVIVNPPLTGDLAKDIKSVKVRDDVERIYANLGIDIRTLDVIPHEKKASIASSITSISVEAIYKNLTGYYRRMDNLNQFERLEKRLVDVKEYLGVSFFEKTLGIKEDNIREFLLYVYGNSHKKYEAFYLQSDYLSMDKLLQEKAPAFLERLNQRENTEENKEVK